MLSSRLGRASRLFVILVFALGSSGYGAIPDRINIPKFKKIFETKQELSAEARTEAVAKKQTLMQKRRVRKNLQNRREQKLWEIEQNNKRVKSLRANNDSLVETINASRTQIQANQTQRKELLTESNRLTTAINLAETRRDQQKTAMERAQSAVNDKESDLAEAQQDLDETQSELSEEREELSTTQGAVATISDELDRLERELRQVSADRAGYENELQTGTNKKSQIATNLQGALDELDRIRLRIQGATGRLNKLQKDVSAAQTEIDQAEGRLSHIENRLGNLRRQKKALNRSISQLNTKIAALTQQIGLLDIEKQRIEESIPLLEQEINKLQGDKQQMAKRIAKLKKDLENATDDAEKKKIQKQLTRTENRLAAVDKDLQAKNAEVRQSRNALLKIPAQKTAKRTELLTQQTTKQVDETELARVDLQIDNTQDRRVEWQQKKKDAQQDKKQASVRLSKVQGNLVLLDQEETQGENDVAELQEDQRRLTRRLRALNQLLTTANRRYRVLDLEAIPDTKQRLSNARNEIARLSGTIRALEAAERTYGRAISQAKTDLSNAQATLNQEQSQLATMNAQLLNLEEQKARALSRRAELLTENQGLEQKITLSQQRITQQNDSINILIGSNLALQKQADELENNIFAAQTDEDLADTVHQLADATATRLENDTKTAKADYKLTVANFESEKGAAIAAATFAATQDGSREGTERGDKAGGPVGETDGKREGTAQGRAEGEQRDYDAAYASAFELSRKKTIAGKALETPAQKALREADPRLEAAFLVGQGKGQTVGQKDGFTAGNNAAQEKAGYEAGYGTGKRNAIAEAERTHRPLGRKQREQEILTAPPKNTEDRDASEEEVSPETLGWLEHVWSQFKGWVLPSAVANGSLGDISEDQVPAVKFTYRKLVTNHDHPEFDRAYEETYNAVYESTYVAQYRASYKGAYTRTYTPAFAEAEKTALAVTYTAKQAEGTEDGKARGLFEGLGYNAGYAEKYPVGKAKGEKVAFERGEAAGTPKGYSENIAGARADSLAAGRRDTDSNYANNVKLRLVEGSTALGEEDGDGKYSVGEVVRLNAKLRNFGGVDAAAGAVEVRVVSAIGVKLNAQTVALGELGQETEFNFSNLLVGEVEPAGKVQIEAQLTYQGTEVGTLKVSKDVYAPYNVTYTYFYDPKEDLRVGGVNNGTGYHNAVWVQALPGADLKGMEIQMKPLNTSLAQFSWQGGGTMNDWKRIPQAQSNGWVKMGIFLRAYSYQGLDSNQFQVKLRDGQGRILMDKVVDAPIEVKR